MNKGYVAQMEEKMEIKEFNVQKINTLFLGQQYDHAVMGVLFTGLLYPERESYLKVYSDKKTELIPLTGNLLTVGRPLTDEPGTMLGQIITLDGGEKEIKNSRIFIMQILPSLGKGELADYPVPPNFETKYKEMEKVIQSAQEKMEDGAF